MFERRISPLQYLLLQIGLHIREMRWADTQIWWLAYVAAFHIDSRNIMQALKLILAASLFDQVIDFVMPLDSMVRHGGMTFRYNHSRQVY